MLTLIGAVRNAKFNNEIKDIKFRKDSFYVIHDDNFLSFNLMVGMFSILKLKNEDVRALYKCYTNSYFYDKKLESMDDYHYFLHYAFLRFVDDCNCKKMNVVKCSELYGKFCDYCNNKSLRIFMGLSDNESLVDS